MSPTAVRLRCSKHTVTQTSQEDRWAGVAPDDGCCVALALEQEIDTEHVWSGRGRSVQTAVTVKVLSGSDIRQAWAALASESAGLGSPLHPSRSTAAP